MVFFLKISLLCVYKFICCFFRIVGVSSLEGSAFVIVHVLCSKNKKIVDKFTNYLIFIHYIFIYKLYFVAGQRRDQVRRSGVQVAECGAAQGARPLRQRPALLHRAHYSEQTHGE